MQFRQLLKRYSEWKENGAFIGTKNVRFSLQYYLMLPWKRPQLKKDAVTRVWFLYGKLIRCEREFYNIVGFTRHYYNAGILHIKYRLSELQFRIENAFRQLAADVTPYAYASSIPLIKNLSGYLFAEAVDSTNSGSLNGGGTVNWSHTCSGSDRTLIVCDMSVFAPSAPPTYNSVNMTKDDSGTTGNTYSGVNHLLSPATGTHTVSTDAGGASYAGASISFTGSGGVGAHNNGTNTGGSSVSVSVTTLVANGYVVGSCHNNNNGGVSAGGSQTSISNGIVPGNAGSFDASYRATTTTGSYSLSWTSGATPNWGMSIIEVQPGTQNTTFTRSLSANVSNGASRSATVARLATYHRSLSATISNAASRLASVAKVKISPRSLSVSVSNASNRLALIVRAAVNGSTTLWATITKHTTSWTAQNKNSTNWTSQNKSDI